MSNYVRYYNRRQDMYRKLAEQWKAWADDSTLSDSQLKGMSLFFKYIGRRFGLIQEFRDIGVI